MIKNLSVKHKLYFGFGTILAVLIILLLLAYNRFQSLAEANNWDKHTMEVLHDIDAVNNAILSIQVEVRGYLLTGNEATLSGGNKDKIAEMKRDLRELIKLTADNPAQNERLKKTETVLTTWADTLMRAQIEKRRSLGNTAGAADLMGQSKELRDSASAVQEGRRLLDEAATEEDRLLAQRSQASQRQQENMLMVLTVGGAVCVTLSLLVVILLSKAILAPLANLSWAAGRIGEGDQNARATVNTGDELGQVGDAFNKMAQAIQASQEKEKAASDLLKSKVDTLLVTINKAAAGDLTGNVAIGGEDAIGQLGDGMGRMFENLRLLINNVQKAGIQVTTSATEIAASAKEQEAMGVEQAQTSVEILATTKEISSNTSQLLKTMEDATAVADYTTSATAEAQGNLRRMDQTMHTMVAATDSINAKLAALSEKASNINSVLTTITKVADQTNILSLNAAIEAEKAGEAGRGFSVVATEIRRLADQTSVSTWDIEQMLKEMQSAVSASVMGMDKFSEEIRRSVGEVRQVVEQLSGVMDQVQKLAPQFDAVLQGMQSQAVGAQQITETMMQLNDATQQTVESLKSTSEAVHQLQYAATDLQSSVATFAVAGGG
ncbi:methyl-accepting chemotaxis protein [Massilia sp. BJB1822]|uniref:methyl-accepting chemotaxis protein n=1 Tax=Massilia sp. BJB1822 TaxID=2744470 RepID=UPI001594574D|nr:methyl-accepting chemotaxis protein [Massilia sp. BJB1822]NVE01207.1 CHASE3 domain-containing protein [Massilia sp. BJB1822]